MICGIRDHVVGLTAQRARAHSSFTHAHLKSRCTVPPAIIPIVLTPLTLFWKSGRRPRTLSARRVRGRACYMACQHDTGAHTLAWASTCQADRCLVCEWNFDGATQSMCSYDVNNMPRLLRTRCALAPQHLRPRCHRMCVQWHIGSSVVGPRRLSQGPTPCHRHHGQANGSL